MTNTQKDSGMEERFAMEFCAGDCESGLSEFNTSEELIDFIASEITLALTKQRAELMEKINNLKVMGIGGSFGNGFENGYRKGKDDILNLLKP